MNAETRAKEVWKGLTEFCSGPAESIRLIEHALIAAQNDKLEEAAHRLNLYSDPYASMHAASIRALKTPKG